ncbi:hypothetical protein ZIOFF_033145 [Zingiber officinale]|uniref:Exonuclease 1 n=1 Tax=Zingiber officinale TaxID=94328 RepID=A0A8J5GWL9_ZINOF|nr:hypothetical protein ZIOFF_033145 [Zingiber officinale]
MSHVLGALLAPSPLLAQAWTRCLRANAGSANFVIDRSDDAVFITFSGTQAVTSSSGLGRGMAPKPLDYELLNENVKKVAYAVKGELYLRASELQKEGKKVVALCQAPFLLDDPNVGLLFPADVIARAKHYLSLNSGGLGMFNRTIRLLEAGIEPVYVFDGQPPELKKQEIAKRLVFTVLYLKRKDATNDLNTTIETGDLEGIEKYSKRTVKAPCEAEAQCAALCKSDKVFAVASENMDTLTFGVPRFLHHLMDPSSKKISVMEFDVSKVLEELRLTMDQFINLCIISGCDYCDNIKGGAIRET